MTNIGHTIEEAYGRLRSEAFDDGVLEKKLTDIMQNICDLTNSNGDDDSAPMEFSFLVDEEVIEDIMDLNISKGAMFPDLKHVLRYLDIYNKVDHRYS